jgi:hypothetical protein
MGWSFVSCRCFLFCARACARRAVAAFREDNPLHHIIHGPCPSDIIDQAAAARFGVDAVITPTLDLDRARFGSGTGSTAHPLLLPLLLLCYVMLGCICWLFLVEPNKTNDGRYLTGIKNPPPPSSIRLSIHPPIHYSNSADEENQMFPSTPFKP